MLDYKFFMVVCCLHISFSFAIVGGTKHVFHYSIDEIIFKRV